MGQATHTGGSGDSVVEYSLNSGSTWNDIGGWLSTMTFDAWNRVTGQMNTLTGDEAIIGFGKLQITGATVNAAYSDGETPADLLATVWAQHITTGGGQLMLRCSPQGTASGKRYIQTNTDAKIDSLTPPNITANSGDPLAISFHVATSGWDLGTN